MAARNQDEDRFNKPGKISSQLDALVACFNARGQWRSTFPTECWTLAKRVRGTVPDLSGPPDSVIENTDEDAGPVSTTPCPPAPKALDSIKEQSPTKKPAEKRAGGGYMWLEMPPFAGPLPARLEALQKALQFDDDLAAQVTFATEMATWLETSGQVYRAVVFRCFVVKAFVRSARCMPFRIPSSAPVDRRPEPPTLLEVQRCITAMLTFAWRCAQMGRTLFDVGQREDGVLWLECAAGVGLLMFGPSGFPLFELLRELAQFYALLHQVSEKEEVAVRLTLAQKWYHHVWETNMGELKKWIGVYGESRILIDRILVQWRLRRQLELRLADLSRRSRALEALNKEKLAKNSIATPRDAHSEQPQGSTPEGSTKAPEKETEGGDESGDENDEKEKEGMTPSPETLLQQFMCNFRFCVYGPAHSSDPACWAGEREERAQCRATLVEILSEYPHERFASERDMLDAARLVLLDVEAQCPDIRSPLMAEANFLYARTLVVWDRFKEARSFLHCAHDAFMRNYPMQGQDPTKRAAYDLLIKCLLHTGGREQELEQTVARSALWLGKSAVPPMLGLTSRGKRYDRANIAEDALANQKTQGARARAGPMHYSGWAMLDRARMAAAHAASGCPLSGPTFIPTDSSSPAVASRASCLTKTTTASASVLRYQGDTQMRNATAMDADLCALSQVMCEMLAGRIPTRPARWVEVRSFLNICLLEASWARAMPSFQRLDSELLRLRHRTVARDEALRLELVGEECWYCGIDRQQQKELQHCIVCLSATYCSIDCQERDWRRHMAECVIPCSFVSPLPSAASSKTT